MASINLDSILYLVGTFGLIYTIYNVINNLQQSKPLIGGGKRQKTSNYNLLLIIIFSSLLVGKYFINVGTEPNLTLNYSY